jgi:peptidoglycan-associated lipoprotein
MFPDFREAVLNHNPVGPNKNSPKERLKMKKLCFAKNITLALAAALPLCGCLKSPYHVTQIPNGGAFTGSTNDFASTTPAISTDDSATKIKTSDADLANGIPQADPSNFDNWNADKTALAAYTVHFDYDSSVVKASEESKLTSVAEAMKGATPVAVRVEGNCDERGTEEYNRSLGDRRANALREKLATLGVDPKKIVTVSYGEDKPIDNGHNEAAYAKNRRGDFVLLTPPTPGQLSKLENNK